jgi:hypothetical protein
LRDPFVAFFQCQVCQRRIEIDRSSSATKGIVAVKIEVSIEHATRELMVATSVGMRQPNDILRLEMWLNDLVQEAFHLTDDERGVLMNSLPLRDPITSITEGMG